MISRELLIKFTLLNINLSKEIHLLTTEVEKIKLHCTTNKCSYFKQTFSIYIEERFVNNDVSLMSTLKGELCKSHKRTLSSLMSAVLEWR